MEFVMLEEVGGSGLVRFEVNVAVVVGYNGAEDDDGCCGCGRDKDCDR